MISGRAVSDFYSRWFKPFVKYILSFTGIIVVGFIVIVLQDRLDLFIPLKHTDSLSLGISAIFLFILFITATLAVFKENKIYALSRFLVPVLLILFLAVFSLFIFSGYFLYDYLISNSPVFNKFKMILAKNIAMEFPFYKVNELKIYKEILVILATLIMNIIVIFVAHRFRELQRFKLLLIPYLIGSAILFLNASDVGRGLTPYIIREPDAVFKKDIEFAPLYKDPFLFDYRINLPQPMREKLFPELGFRKCIHNYCCRQYMDNLRFSFAIYHGPSAYETVKSYVNERYDHPYWKLYNVKYIVDEFKDNSFLLPRDSNSYERISDNIIRLKDTKQSVFFMDRYTIIDREQFMHVVLPTGDASILELVYLHDIPENSLPFDNTKPSYNINILERGSGKLRAKVSTNKAGFLIFSEIWASSWHVYVDGAEKKLLKAYGMLQAVQIDTGEHEVFFEYNIFKSWQMRLAISAYFVALMVIISAVWYRFKKDGL